MNDENKSQNPEVLTRKRRSATPAMINDLEDQRIHNNLMERLYGELAPQNILGESDLLSVGQLRWNSDRLHSVRERELNTQVRMPFIQRHAEPAQRLMLSHRACHNERAYQFLTKQLLDSTKGLNTLSSRVEKWAPPAKTTRKSKEM